ncbi:unnamed protein product [Angiostrongylus costaricensis]|uniref:Uncharacterized protein n=1 Tax=Angiostrongylus costaricensis TaxID=334426 RepID=A0A0R3PNJ4_ANGCS|nr:unnamed protein product [Angiostrongylus costaricensis]
MRLERINNRGRHNFQADDDDNDKEGDDDDEDGEDNDDDDEVEGDDDCELSDDNDGDDDCVDDDETASMTTTTTASTTTGRSVHWRLKDDSIEDSIIVVRWIIEIMMSLRDLGRQRKRPILIWSGRYYESDIRRFPYAMRNL